MVPALLVALLGASESSLWHDDARSSELLHHQQRLQDARANARELGHTATVRHLGSIKAGLRAVARHSAGAVLDRSAHPPHVAARVIKNSFPRAASPAGGVVDASEFADPTGVADASPGLQKAIEALVAGSGPAKPYWAGAHDLSGRRLDLKGGQYMLNSPLFIPGKIANFEVSGGTLFAGPSFPRGKPNWGPDGLPGDSAFLLTLGNETDAMKSTAAGYIESVQITDVLFQGAGIAGGGLKIIYGVGLSVGPSVYVDGFTGVGIRIDEGAEVMVHDAWVCGMGMPGHDVNGTYANTIGVQINGNDHYVVDTVVWQLTTLGIHVNGGANLLSGVHAWGCGTSWCAPPASSTPLTGISIQQGRCRVLGCYLDFNYLDIDNPTDIIVANSFFLGTHTRLIASYDVATKGRLPGVMNGLTMTGNSYDRVEMIGNFSSPTARAHIGDDNIPPAKHNGTIGMALTTVRRTLRSRTGEPQQNFTVDFSDSGVGEREDTLLLPTIDFLQYSVVFESPLSPAVPHQAVSSYSGTGTRVTVVFESPVLATVYVEARCCTGGAL